LFVMEKAAADSARVRGLLDPKLDELKEPCALVKEGFLDMSEKKNKQERIYMFLFHNIIIITKEVKPQEKYKVVIVIKLRSSLKVFNDEENEDGPACFVVDTGKRQFNFTCENDTVSSEWETAISGCLDGEYDPDFVKPVFDEVDGKKIWNVRASLKPEQIKKLDELHEIADSMELDEKTKKWCDDACLCRFLRARDWDVPKAKEMLEATTKWRMETKPDEITYEEIHHAGSTGDLYISQGKDRKGRVIVYMRPGKSKDTPEIRSQYVRHMAWIMETGCDSLDTPHTAQEKLTWIVDFEGCKISGGIEENVKMSRDTINVMQNMYPERLGMGFILNPPLPFFVLWKVVGAFLDPVTKRKIQFIRKKKDFPLLLEFIDKSQLEKSYGGTIEPFNADEWKANYFPDA